jgi:hypothetical protein
VRWQAKRDTALDFGMLEFGLRISICVSSFDEMKKHSFSLFKRKTLRQLTRALATDEISKFEIPNPKSKAVSRFALPPHSK